MHEMCHSLSLLMACNNTPAGPHASLQLKAVCGALGVLSKLHVIHDPTQEATQPPLLQMQLPDHLSRRNVPCTLCGAIRVLDGMSLLMLYLHVSRLIDALLLVI